MLQRRIGNARANEARTYSRTLIITDESTSKAFVVGIPKPPELALLGMKNPATPWPSFSMNWVSAADSLRRISSEMFRRISSQPRLGKARLATRRYTAKSSEALSETDPLS